MIRSKAYVEAGKKKIKNAPAYGLSMDELETLIMLAYADGNPLNAIGTAFYIGIEAGYRMASKRPQRESYEMGYKDGYKTGKAEHGIEAN